LFSNEEVRVRGFNDLRVKGLKEVLKMKKILMALLVTGVLLSTTTAAHAVLSAEGRYWFTTLDSNVTYNDVLVGTEIDLIDDLGVEDSKAFTEGRIALKMGKHNLRYSYAKLSWKGDKALSRTINFGGETYAATTQVNSTLDIGYHRLGYEYDLFDTLSNKIGLIFDIKYLDLNVNIKAAVGGTDKTLSSQIPIPTIGAIVKINMPALFSVTAEATGITLGSTGYLYDAEAMVSFHPLPFVNLSGGYRMFVMDFEYDNDKFAFDLTGPFLSLGASF